MLFHVMLNLILNIFSIVNFFFNILSYLFFISFFIDHFIHFFFFFWKKKILEVFSYGAPILRTSQSSLLLTLSSLSRGARRASVEPLIFAMCVSRATMQVKRKSFADFLELKRIFQEYILKNSADHKVTNAKYYYNLVNFIYS